MKPECHTSILGITHNDEVTALTETDGNSHSKLPRWLSHLSSVRCWATISQIPPPQPFRMPGTQGQLCQERTIPQPNNIVPGSSFRLSPNVGSSHARTCTGHSEARGLLQSASRPLKMFQKMLGLMASASPVLQLGLLHMRPLQYWLKPWVPSHAYRHGCLCIKVDQACMAALAPWKDPQWMERGIALGMVCRRKVVSTDVSNTGWGALCDGKPTFSPWLKEESRLHINCLEMLAVCRALHTFLPDLRGHHVLVHSDSMTVVSYINRQGALTSKRLFFLAHRLLEWAQLNLHSLRATHVPGRLNQGADMLSWSNVPSEEWILHPQTV